MLGDIFILLISFPIFLQSFLIYKLNNLKGSGKFSHELSCMIEQEFLYCDAIKQ